MNRACDTGSITIHKEDFMKHVGSDIAAGWVAAHTATETQE
jgi:hypothetical protein